jgi:ferric-dicitrate binding protein FerR (iron transport regulator)
MMSSAEPPIDDVTAGLISKFLAGEASEEEFRRLAAWRADSPKNEARFREFMRVWASSAQRVDQPEPDVDAAWERFKVAAAAKEIGTRRWGRRSWLASAAAAFALLLGVQWSVLRGPVSVEATPGVIQTVELADGSVVRLSPGSTLTFPRRFGNATRDVVLEGEAFFDVEPGEAPFVVMAGTGRVTVLGTEFSVRQTARSTYVAVREGRVRLASSSGSEAADLVAGDAAVYQDGLRQLSEEHFDAAFAWMSGTIAFVEAPAFEVAAELSRRFGRPVRLGSAVDSARSLTLTLDSVGLAEAVETFSATLGLTVTPAAGGYLVGR